MPTSSLKPLDPDMRQQLAAMLSGDAKAGSVRADLVRGLLGSQTGDDSGLVGMTPLGAAFDVSAANRDRRQGGSGAGHMLSAAAGMIPGAGPEAHAAIEALHPLEAELLNRALAHATGDKAADVSEHELPTILNAAQSTRQMFNPRDQKILQSAVARLTPENSWKPGTIMAGDELDGKPSGIRAQLEEASKNDDKGAIVVDAKTPPTVAGVDTSISKATKPAKVTPHDVSNGDATEAVNLLEKHNPDRLNQILMDYAPGAEDKDHLIQLLNEGLSPEEHSSLLNEARESVPTAKSRPTQ